MITALTHPAPPQSLCAAVVPAVFNNGLTVSVVGDVKQDFPGFMRFSKSKQQILSYVMFSWSCLRVHGSWLLHVVLFLRWVNTKQSQILLADKTIDSCVIATVVDDGPTAAPSDCGGPVWVNPVIIIAWYKVVL